MLHLLWESWLLFVISPAVFSNLVHLKFLGETNVRIRALHNVLCFGRVGGCAALAELPACYKRLQKILHQGPCGPSGKRNAADVVQSR